MIALIGGYGSIGKRYASVLRYLNEPHIIVEKDDEIEPHLWEKAIIATPTLTHFEIAEFFKERGIPFLLEKPPCTEPDQALVMSTWDSVGCEGYIVNNYAFLDLFSRPVTTIDWDFYNSGKDGITWDLSQLIYLAKLHGASITCRRILPEWTLKLNGIQVPYQEIQATYIDMLRAFINGETEKLWSIKRAYDFVKSVLEVDASKENFFHHEFKL